MGIVAEFESANWVTEDAVATVPSVTCADGDVLVASAVCGNQLRTLGISGGGLTWTQRGSVSATSRCSVTQWTAPVGVGQGGTFAVTATFSGDGIGGLSVLVAEDIAAVGASGQADAADPTAPSLAITTGVANAIIVVAVGDHATVDGAARTWRTGAGALTETTYSRVDFSNAAYVGYHADAGAAGSKTVGLTAPATMRSSIVAVELQPDTAGSDVTGTITGDFGALGGGVTATREVTGAVALDGGALAGGITGVREVVGAAAFDGGALTGVVTADREVPATVALSFGGLGGGVTATREVAGSVTFAGGALGGGVTASSDGLVHANTTLVTKAWLATIAALVGVEISSTLPAVAKWAAKGAITVGPTFPGAPERYAPLRHPIVQVDCWAVFTPNSKKLNHGLANHLAEVVLNASYEWDVPVITMPPGIKPVHLGQVYPVSEVRWVPDPDSNFAHYAVDLHVGWVEQGAMTGVNG